MTGVWVAVVALSVLAVVEGIALVALAREVGLLSRRLPQAPALESMEGPAVGSSMPTLDVTDLRTRQPRTISPDGERKRVLVFLSTRCSVCNQLLSEMDGVILDWQDLDVVPILSGPRREAEDMVSRAGYAGPAVQDDGGAMRAAGILTTPRALVLDERGTVQARGVVNTREMVASMIEGNLRQAGGALWVEGDQIEAAR